MAAVALQQPDLMADGGRRDAEFRGRLPEAQVAGHGREGPQFRHRWQFGHDVTVDEIYSPAHESIRRFALDRDVEPLPSLQRSEDDVLSPLDRRPDRSLGRKFFGPVPDVG